MKNKLPVLLILLLVASVWASEYKVALPGYHYQFPRDHFSHPAYQTEWWYYTGNVKATDGHRFGFELTFFRQGVARDKDNSPWHIHDLYMAHLALSDINGGRFYHSERINRAGPGTAGINERTGLIWNGNWQVHLDNQRQQLRGIGETFDLDLNLKAEKPPVIHGRNGISQKAEGEGHASHYISFTRLLTSGSIELDGNKYTVEGTSWMDHEFFSESLDSGEIGWDWLSLQLDDNSELMLYRLRHKDGSVDSFSSGSYVDAHGHTSFLSSKDFTMIPSGEIWTSPKSKGAYPVQWHVTVPSLGMLIDVTTPLLSQELTSAIGPSYWEGAIDIIGQHNGDRLHGDGYLEMTGYGSDASGAVLDRLRQ
ncbi:MAG: lipocalin-like domain-containing protein [Terriglobales bacterium]